MRPGSIMLCGNSTDFMGMQVFLEDDNVELGLMPLGYTNDCEVWKIPDEQYVS